MVISVAEIEILAYLTSRQMFKVKHVKVPLRILGQQLYSSPLKWSHYSFECLCYCIFCEGGVTRAEGCTSCKGVAP